MRIRVQMFAGARALAGRDVVELDLPEGATIRELRQRLEGEYPPLGPLLARSRLAVDDDYVGEDEPLIDGGEVALIPPVSGGAMGRGGSPFGFEGGVADNGEGQRYGGERSAGAP